MLHSYSSGRAPTYTYRLYLYIMSISYKQAQSYSALISLGSFAHNSYCTVLLLLQLTDKRVHCIAVFCAAVHAQAEQVNVVDASHGTAAVTIAHWIADNPPEPP
jgi:hypothetical protein